jgi:UV DNA damage endonuclease
MIVGYPCINQRIGCTANSTFRLKNYSKKKLIEKVAANLACLKKILNFNIEHKLLFFRIGSSLVPFASHPICRFNWRKHFREEFKEIGAIITANKMRISMHPDQFVIINALDNKIVSNSIKELEYHCKLLDAMELNSEAKVIIHVGGVYGEKEKSIKRFIKHYKNLPSSIKKRLVIENDHRSYSLADCLKIYQKTGIPVVFDVYHHQCLNQGESLRQSIILARKTWKKKDGKLVVHYSNQGKRKGSHSRHINLRKFKSFLGQVKGLDFDVMLEVKDKEKSALKAVKLFK